MKFSNQLETVKEGGWWRNLKLRFLKRFFPKKYNDMIFKEYEQIWAEEHQEGEQAQDKISAYDLTRALKVQLDEVHNEEAMMERYKEKRKQELIERLENEKDENEKEILKWLLKRY